MVMSEWISVRERLPKVGEIVYVKVFYANCENIHQDRLIKSDEWETYAWSCVTAWKYKEDA